MLFPASYDFGRLLRTVQIREHNRCLLVCYGMMDHHFLKDYSSVVDNSKNRDFFFFCIFMSQIVVLLGIFRLFCTMKPGKGKVLCKYGMLLWLSAGLHTEKNLFALFFFQVTTSLFLFF